VEAVIDKDLSGALLARTVGADVFVIATDVANAVLHYEQPDAEPIGQVDPATMRTYAAAGHFASGSMGPKVEAALRFVEAGGTRSVITNLAGIGRGATGEHGTVIAAVATGAGHGTRPAEGETTA
jgi:carbamate kinase